MSFPSRLLWIFLALFTASVGWAAGSGLNVIVVVNQRSTNSIRLGNDYCEQRGVPPQNLFRMTGWSGGSTSWSRMDFEEYLRNPLLDAVASRGLTNQAQFVLLSMDIPYTVVDGASVNSTTSVLFYGFKTNAAAPGPGLPASCSLPDSSSNSYCFSELPFSAAPPNTASTNSFLAMMLTDSNIAGAELVLSRGVASDSTFPTQTVYLAQTSDSARNVRFYEFDNAVFDSRVRGDNSVVRISSNSTSFTNLLGLLTGLANSTLPANAFVDGAISDSLTSSGGIIFGNNSQTSLLAFLEAGAAGSYGAVVEPCNYTQKFPSPLDYVYQDRGFSLAEAYYQSILNPYQGLLVGEPLSSPFARPGGADWSSLTNGAELNGPAVLNIIFSSGATNLPLGQVDLFVDGVFYQTLTNLPPTAGNALSVTLNRSMAGYVVPANATLASVVAGLAGAVNQKSNSTHVIAYPIGDRLELDSIDPTRPGSQVTLSAAAMVGAAARSTTVLTPAQPAFLDTIATGYLGLSVSKSPQVGDWLQISFLKTNGALVSVSVTNAMAGLTNNTAFVQSLFNQINATPDLQSADGALASDFLSQSSLPLTTFSIYARSPGWPAAQIQVSVAASASLLASPSGTNRLEDNVSDLRPRNHLYVTSGVTTLPVNCLLDTTQFADGFHDLTAVAYEGSSVRTQTSVSRTVRIRNTALSATLSPVIVESNATLETLLQFAVGANSTNIARLELFSSGGSIGAVSNNSAAVFPVSFAALGAGLHPFYALATDSFGNQYRTQTQWFRFPLIKLALNGPPWTLSWPALPGQRYVILAAADLNGAFQAVDSVTPTNSMAQWPLPTSANPAGFYRAQLAP